MEVKGLPINTEKCFGFPTYCGQPIPADFAKQISPSESGISMSLGLFRYTIELIRNILHLSTEISMFKLKPLKNFPSDFDKKLYMKDKLELVRSFLSLLYQPYTIYATLNEKLNWVLGGSTPISRFTYHFHSVLLCMQPKFVFETYISVYNHALRELCKKNIDIYNRLDPDNPVFHPFRELKFYIDIIEVPEEKMEILDNIDSDHIKDFIGSKIKKIVPFGAKIPDELEPYARVLETQISEESLSKIPEVEGTILELSNDSIHYAGLINILMDIEKHFFITYEDSNITINYKDIDNIDDSFKDLSDLFNNVAKLGKQILIENINTYISNINYSLSLDENGEYDLQFRSRSLLQSFFFEIAQFLDGYVVSICKYPPCNNLVLSTPKKPASCCCHNHYTNYKSLLDNNSKKLLQ